MAAKYSCFRRRLPIIGPLPRLWQVIYSQIERAIAECFYLTMCCFNRTSFSWRKWEKRWALIWFYTAYSKFDQRFCLVLYRVSWGRHAKSYNDGNWYLLYAYYWIWGANPLPRSHDSSGFHHHPAPAITRPSWSGTDAGATPWRVHWWVFCNVPPNDWPRSQRSILHLQYNEVCIVSG